MGGGGGGGDDVDIKLKMDFTWNIMGEKIKKI